MASSEHSLQADASRFVGRSGRRAAALEEIPKHLPDVALLDYRLPELDGVEVTHAVVRDGLPTPRATGLCFHRQRARL